MTTRATRSRLLLALAVTLALTLLAARAQAQRPTTLTLAQVVAEATLVGFPERALSVPCDGSPWLVDGAHAYCLLDFGADGDPFAAMELMTWVMAEAGAIMQAPWQDVPHARAVVLAAGYELAGARILVIVWGAPGVDVAGVLVQSFR